VIRADGGGGAPARIVVIGTSLGGLHALEVLLGGFAIDFPLPIAVVQHRGVDAEARSLLTSLLQLGCVLPVVEADDKQPLQGGRVYFGPPDYHLLVERGQLALSTDARVCHARPSIDVLFESAADAYGDGVIAVVLTGASADGAAGATRVRERGGTVVAQDPRGAEAPAMPAAAIATGAVHHVLPLDEIAPFLHVATAPVG
jgi:two-component system chemotaxis response regulator CheB